MYWGAELLGGCSRPESRHCIKEVGQCFPWTLSADVLMSYVFNLSLRTWLAFFSEPQNSFLSVDADGKPLFHGGDKSAFI